MRERERERGEEIEKGFRQGLVVYTTTRHKRDIYV